MGHPMDNYSLLKELVILTSPFLGDEFFRKSTQAFGQALGADWVFIARVLDTNATRVRVLGAWQNGATADEWDFALEGTPCSVIYDSNGADLAFVRVNGDSHVHVSRNMCEIFPAARDTGFQSFLGLPLWSRNREMVGHVAMFFEEPLENQQKADQLLEMLQILAHRAEAELYRLLLEEEKNNALLALEAANQQLFEESRTDPLTGLYNRRFFTQRCEEAHAQSLRTDRPYSMLLIDVDFFKSINDKYGHDVGDHVLCVIARIMSKYVRGGDIVARLGGEEFGILCQDADALLALNVVGERLRMAIASQKIDHGDHSLRVSVSVGVAGGAPSSSEWQSTYCRADKALYEAKSKGRNAVRLAMTSS